MIVVRVVGVPAASPRALLITAVRWTAALASGAAAITAPKSAVMPNAARTGTDKRMLSPCYRVQGVIPRSKALFGMPARRFGPGTLYRIYRELVFETFLTYLFLFRDKPEYFVTGRTLNKFAKSDRVPLSMCFRNRD
jgi:hypothetical protein